MLDNFTCLFSFFYVTQFLFIYSFPDYLFGVYKMLECDILSMEAAVSKKDMNALTDPKI